MHLLTCRVMRHLVLAALVLGLLASTAPAAEGDLTEEHPLSRSKVSLLDGSRPEKRRIVFRARWQGAAELPNPSFAGSTLRVAGTGPGDGDSGLIQLDAGKWTALGDPPGSEGYVYDDPTQSVGGIRSIIVKQGRGRAVFKVVGGSTNWRYAVAGPQSGVALTFTIGSARWCAEFKSFSKNRARRVKARSRSAPSSCPCERFESTFAAIQKVVFEKHGCTQAVCHGSAPGQGNLDLSPAVAYDNLVDVISPLAAHERVKRGLPTGSFLYEKLAAATLGLTGVPGTPMPNGLPPIPENELEAVRLWIHAGAPREGVIPNTELLLSSCLPPPDPIKIPPPPAPPVTEGIQLHAPPWDIEAGGEDEVCYATYFDFSATIPAEHQTPCPEFWGGPSKNCFFYNKSDLTQDPNSHHSIIHLYKGEYQDPNDPAANFGPWTCRGGAMHGQPCNPVGIGQPAPAGADCGADSGCAGNIRSSTACIGYGPPDYSVDIAGGGGTNSPTIGGSQQPYSDSIYPPGVFAMIPVKGIVVWNSHAFNVTDQPTTNEQFLNIYFAGPSDRTYVVNAIFDSNDIFIQNVPPFEQREYCRTHTLPRGARLFELSSHTHKRGKLFRIYGPGITDRCGCAEFVPRRSGCTETTLTPPDQCPAGGAPLIFTTTDYSDPTVLRFNPPLEFDGEDESSRTFKFCTIYDNGATFPQEVKRQSTSPNPPPPLRPEFGFGGPCPERFAACLAGPSRGQLCNGDDRMCDSAPGSNDGQCDACPLWGGVTTEDEMFILLGLFYRVPLS
jgi:hypothetical protein